MLSRLETGTNTLGVYDAIKNGEKFLIKATYDLPQYREGLLNEAPNAQALDGIEGIVRIVESGIMTVDTRNVLYDQPQTGVIFVVKEWIEGKTLADPTVELTPQLREQLWKTMKEVHGRGFCYENDLKLNDIVLNREGKPVVVDLEWFKPMSSYNRLFSQMTDHVKMLRLFSEKTGTRSDYVACYGYDALRVFPFLREEIACVGVGIIAATIALDGIPGLISDSEHTLDYVKVIGGGLTAFTAGSGFVGSLVCKATQEIHEKSYR